MPPFRSATAKSVSGSRNMSSISLERERRGSNHRFVADPDCAETERTRKRQDLLAHAQQRQTPSLGMADAAELVEEIEEFPFIANRIAAHERRAADNPVREEASPCR